MTRSTRLKQDSMATNIKFAKPAVIDVGYGVSAQSAPIIITLDDGSNVKGFMQKWLCDVNAEHIAAKKGDVLFSTDDNVLVENAASWEYIKETIEL